MSAPKSGGANCNRQARAIGHRLRDPQPHACFIQSIADDLANEGGIMDLWVGDSV